MTINIEHYFSHLSLWHIKQTVNFAELGALGDHWVEQELAGELETDDPHRFCDSSWDDGHIIFSPGCQGDNTGWGAEVVKGFAKAVSQWMSKEPWHWVIICVETEAPGVRGPHTMSGL